jgi:hypothetical protein
MVASPIIQTPGFIYLWQLFSRSLVVLQKNPSDAFSIYLWDLTILCNEMTL